TIFGALAVLVRRYRRSTQATNFAHADAEAQARDVLAEAQREVQRADVLNVLADRVTFANGESDLVEAATSALRRLLPSVAGDVLLLNNSQNRLMVAAIWGLADHEVGRPATIDSPSLCPGIRRGSVYAIGDGADDLRVSCAVHPIDAGSSLCVPMLALGKSIGVIHLTRSENDAFDSPSQQLAARVAEQIALGLANARLIQTMERLAMADPLTGLNNARFFDPVLDRELAVAKRDGSDVSIVMIDIDHFKKLNDTHGHPGGDEALKAFARAVTGAVRESDTIARYGGEEFVVLLRDTDLAGATIAAEKIRAAVERTVVEIGPNRTARMTASFGTASTSANGNDRMLLMRIADAALYRAKESGRNRVVAADSDFSSPATPESSNGAPESRILVKRTSRNVVPRIA
ncbi:MAG: sensor domain-containing diguanylate cyclase, partial [Candidatus Limnocylindrales bacterium]